jgi:hypothetical protein
MSEQKLVETRMELSYGLHYSRKALKEGTRNVGMAELGILEARMSIGRAVHYLTGRDPYPNQSNTDNNVIERSTDLMDDNDVTFNPEFDRIKHLKFLISGYKLGLEKVVGMRMERMAPGMSPKNQFLYTRSLDRAIDKIENSICFLGGELRMIAETDPEGDSKYPSSAPVQEVKVGNDTVADAKSTDEIIKERAGVTSGDDVMKTVTEETPVEKTPELDPNRPLTGEDYLPGGRAYVDPNAEEEVVLTEGDAQADLDGTPQPDNPTPEATAMQEAEGNEKEDSSDSSEDSSEETKEETT